VTGDQSRHHRHDHDLDDDGHIAFDADGEIAEQRRGLVTRGRAGEPGACRFGAAEQDDRGAAADGAALEAEQEKMVLELAGDKLSVAPT
jgi:hypothetical protein